VKSYSQLVSHEIGAAVSAKYARRTWLVYFTDHIVEIFMCFGRGFRFCITDEKRCEISEGIVGASVIL
jgi:hypothetical protein